MANKLTSEKALQILSEGRVHGNRLTRKQKKFFGAVAGGAAPEKAENGIEGTMGGLTDKGFNFNPAWGGAWKNGGWLEKYTDSVPEAQFGLKYTYLEPNDPKFPRVTTSGTPPETSSEKAGSVGGENGEPAYLIPSMKYGRMQVDPLFEFKRTGEHLGGPFKTWQEAEAWERDVRHPYVEKGQSIPTPYRRWGQFAMGGSLPGSVGFTYARVAGAAPSEGPRAKKTMPSAQNGKEMKYYQEGLDWRPKTISKNGGWLDKFDDGGVVKDDMGYWNPENVGKVVEIDSPYITMKGVDQPLIGVSDTGDVQYMEPGNDYEFDGTSVREYPVAQGGRQVSSRTSGPRIISPSIPTSADSLRVYDAAVAMMNYYANDKRHKKPEINVHDPLIERARVETVGKENLDQYRKMYKDISNPSFDYENSFYKIDYGLPRREMLRRIGRAIDEAKSAPPGVSYYKDAYPSKIDINAPSAVVDYRISPQGFINFRSSVPGYREVGKFLPEPAGSVTGLYYYDPLAIKPYDKRTEKEKAEWEKKYGKPKPKPLVKKETPKTETKKAPVKSVPQTTDQLGMFRNPKVELLVDDFGNYEWFRTDDDIGDLKPIRRATREEIEYSKKQKQRNGGVSVNRADEYPLEKLDNLLNFTNYNKPKAKNGWLEKYK